MKITHNKVGQNINLVDGLKQEKTDAAKGLKDARPAGAIGDPKALGADGGEKATKIDVSERAQQAKRIKELANAAPDVDMEKVERFRKLVDSGEYKVDARAVADRMVDEELATKNQ